MKRKSPFSRLVRKPAARPLFRLPPARVFDIHAHRIGENMGKSRFAEARRTLAECVRARRRASLRFHHQLEAFRTFTCPVTR